MYCYPTSVPAGLCPLSVQRGSRAGRVVQIPPTAPVPIPPPGRCLPTSRPDRTTCRRSWVRSAQALPALQIRSGARGYHSSRLLTFPTLTSFVCLTIWWGSRTVITLKWNRRWNICASEAGAVDTPKWYGPKIVCVRGSTRPCSPTGSAPSPAPAPPPGCGCARRAFRRYE
jgi:hypothetical protein